MLGKQQFNEIFAQCRKSVEHKKGTPQRNEYNKHDYEHFKRFSFVIRRLLIMIIIIITMISIVITRNFMTLLWLCI